MSEPKKRFERAISVRNGPHQGTDFLMVEDQRSGKDRRLSTTPPPAPAGEREAFEAAYVKVCGYPAATIANFWEPTQQYYMDDGLQSHWLLWDARASSPAPALDLTGEEIRAARNAISAATGLRLEVADSRKCHLAIQSCREVAAHLQILLDRLTTPADGEGGR